eukprot:GHRR01021773.1.p1 GENE.GHRR01021773.1~~GHRR01021773.1.p1  ORF type:complete len:153 (-),score=49.82 GHRR01021773.1:649-1107(-)
MLPLLLVYRTRASLLLHTTARCIAVVLNAALCCLSGVLDSESLCCIHSYLPACAALTGLALACCCTALALPYVADLMAFVGALLTMSISLIMPALMHIKLMWQELPWWGVAFDVLVLLLGVTCAGVGATSALQSLQQKLSHTYAVAAVAAAL